MHIQGTYDHSVHACLQEKKKKKKHKEKSSALPGGKSGTASSKNIIKLSDTACSVCASVHQTQGHMLSSSCIVQIPAQTVSLLVHHMTQIWSQQLQKLVQQLLRQLHCLLDQLLLLDLLWNVKTG